LEKTPHDIVKIIGNISIVKNHADPLGATAYIVKPQAAATLIGHAKDVMSLGSFPGA